jgi:hypothetical protein
MAGETGMFEIVMRRHNQRLYRVARPVLPLHIVDHHHLGLADVSDMGARSVILRSSGSRA